MEGRKEAGKEGKYTVSLGYVAVSGSRKALKGEDFIMVRADVMGLMVSLKIIRS